jgi:hypothetical protein
MHKLMDITILDKEENNEIDLSDPKIIYDQAMSILENEIGITAALYFINLFRPIDNFDYLAELDKFHEQFSMDEIRKMVDEFEIEFNKKYNIK